MTQATFSGQSARGTHTVPAGRSSEVVFENSRSQAQGYYNPSHEIPERKDEGAFFRRSSSQPQNIVTVEKVNERHGVVWRLKNAFFKSENVMSTVMTLGFLKAWTNKVMGAWGINLPTSERLTGENSPIGALKQRIPSIPGSDVLSKLVYGKNFDKTQLKSTHSTKPQSFFENTLAIGTTMGLIQNLIFFMSKRGGEIPEGDTRFQRAVNSFKHPDKHSVHQTSATMSILISLISLSRVGIAVQDRGKEGLGKRNAVYMITGLAGCLCVPLIFAGLFNIKKAENAGDVATPSTEVDTQKRIEQEAQQMADSKKEGGKTIGVGKNLVNSLKPAHLKEMWQYAYKNDKMGLVGRAMLLMVDMGFIMHGRLQLGKDPQNTSAYKTVKGGLTGLVLSCIQLHFVYDRLLTNSKQGAAAPAH